MHLLPVLLLLLPGSVLAHGGGLDEQGGHTSAETGQYHCHQKPCDKEQTANTDETRDTGYDRDAWPHWRDEDGDCRDTRAEVLIRTSQVPVTYKRTERCVVASGLWIDPYTGKTFRDASRLDIDHLVPLRHAHDHGAAQWDRQQRRTFANDPDNLIAVSAGANRSKGADGPADWLPDNRDFRCEYGQRWMHIKREYELNVTRNNRRAVEQLRQSCDQARVTHR